MQNRAASSATACHVPDASALDRILRLSAFDGDSAAALRTLHAHFAARFPDCSLALVLVGGQAPGQCRLAGLIGPDGTEHVPNVDPFGERTTLPLFGDALTARLFAANAPRVVRVAPTEFALPFAQALLAAGHAARRARRQHRRGAALARVRLDVPSALRPRRSRCAAARDQPRGEPDRAPARDARAARRDRPPAARDRRPRRRAARCCCRTIP